MTSRGGEMDRRRSTTTIGGGEMTRTLAKSGAAVAPERTAITRARVDTIATAWRFGWPCSCRGMGVKQDKTGAEVACTLCRGESREARISDIGDITGAMRAVMALLQQLADADRGAEDWGAVRAILSRWNDDTEGVTT